MTNPYFEWGDDHLLRIRWHDTVLYETHVRRFTMRHPDNPEPLRDTYAGLAHLAAVEYLQRLGVTAVELMPVHQFVHDHRLVTSEAPALWAMASSPGCSIESGRRKNDHVSNGNGLSAGRF